MGVFDDLQHEAFPFKFSGTLHVPIIAGGTPTDPKVAEGWLKKQLGVTDEEQIRQLVAKLVVERGITAEQALAEANDLKLLNGFKRDEKGLYIEGRQLKSGLKEAASVAVAAGKLSLRGWGKTNKNLLNYLSEHVFVVEERLHLGVAEASGVNQRFVHTWRGDAIQYEEYVTDAKIHFTVITDHDFTRKEWGMIWLTGQQQGIGASRSQGYGTYELVEWEQVEGKASKKKA